MADQPNLFGERSAQGSMQWDYKSYAQSSAPYQLDLSKSEESQKTASEEKKSDHFETEPQPAPPAATPGFLGQFVSRLWNNTAGLKLSGAQRGEAIGSAAETALASSDTLLAAGAETLTVDEEKLPSLGDLYARQVKYSSVVFLPDAEQDNRVQAYAYYNPLAPYFTGLTSEYPSVDSFLFMDLEPSYLALGGDASEEIVQDTAAAATAKPQESAVVAQVTTEDPLLEALSFDTADSSYSYSYDYYDDTAVTVTSVLSPKLFATTGVAAMAVQTAIPVFTMASGSVPMVVAEVQSTGAALLASSNSSDGVTQETPSATHHEGQSAAAAVTESLSVAEDQAPATQKLEAAAELATEQNGFTWSRTVATPRLSQEDEASFSWTGSDLVSRETKTALRQTGATVEYGASSENITALEDGEALPANRASVSYAKPAATAKKSRRSAEDRLNRDDAFESRQTLSAPVFLPGQPQQATDSGNTFAARDNARFINASALMGMRRPAERSAADLSLDEATLVRTMEHRLSTVSSSNHTGSGHGDSQQEPDWALWAGESGAADGEARPEAKAPLYAEDLEDLPNPLVITDAVIV